MNLSQKLEYLQNNYRIIWLKTRKEVENELSNQQGMFCICGKLATGFHEINCSRFTNKVTGETVKRLKKLIVK